MALQEARDVLYFLRINAMPQSLIGLELDWRASRLQLLEAFLSVHILHLQ